MAMESSAYDCMFFCDGGCVQRVDRAGRTASVALGGCPHGDPEERVLRCPLAAVDDMEKTSMIEKRAAWADVKAKAEAIAATGGVVITRDDSEEVDSIVTSAQVSGRFPVYKGGPYGVILAKKAWENEHNVGGWVQSYLCDCKWGSYHDGQPGAGWQGRFCGHALATLMVSNARARSNFFGDRTASMVYNETGFCSHCGKYGERDGLHELCPECFEEEAFNAMVARLYSENEEERREAVAFLDQSVPETMQRGIRDAMKEHEFGGVMCVSAGAHRVALPVAASGKCGYNKSATRIFSQQEQKALQEESLGQLARNRDRYKGEQASLY
jgi:hypothetical protein